MRLLTILGEPVVWLVEYVGGAANLTVDTVRWIGRGIAQRHVRMGLPAIETQLVRLGVGCITVICLVCSCVGIILALQMAPPLEEFGQTSTVANIIAIAVVRELGPLLSGIVLTGYAGASVAAELGTMVVGEEVEALEAHALNPVRFLVLPRMLATIVAMLVLTLLGEFVAIFSGWAIGVGVLALPSQAYIHNTIDQLDVLDLVTGLWKSIVFGVIIAAIACYNGLSVTGGAAGVGRATTNTVVHSIISLIFADLIFTAMFYRLGWN